ncbi:hypothetical protein DFO53_4245 [Enterobacter sp. AG5470]|nr:hypothetical protein DFO53_4245 [Enterobacter sp. AG5470]
MNEIIKEHLSPFLSILIGVNTAQLPSKELHNLTINLIEKEINAKLSFQKFASVSELSGDTSIEITPYRINKIPSWTKRNDIYDIENHIAVTFCLGRYIAFYFSEKGMKDSVREHFQSSYLKGIRPVDIAHLNFHFINEDSIKMLWLLGIHGKNTFKADSKVLGGKSVAESLDPLEDQSYMMSAVRTELANSSKTIGLNPFKSSIWRGPCKDWETFEKYTIEILDTLNNNNKNNINPIGILASPINDFTGVHDAYDLAIIDPDFLSYEQSEYKLELLRNIRDNYTFEVSPSLSNADIILKVHNNNMLCGEIKVNPSIKDYEISFTVDFISTTKEKKESIVNFSKIFRYPELIKCWYESGHAIVNGWIFITNYRDVIYDNFKWADFEDYDICQEKPITGTTTDLNLIGLRKSLFCWVKNRWSSRWENEQYFNTTEKPTGWLYCDDGAGEKADFIHIDDYHNNTIISLIHVKAAKSDSKNRRISVGAHDIVLSQAVKNLRYANRKNLINDLTERAKTSEHKKCWHNNIPTTSDIFINHLATLTANPNQIKTRVIVIQPHTVKSFYEKNTNSNIKKQLDVLLVSTNNAIKSSGAEFYIIGYHD